jgi:hypothetical protein
VSRWTEADLKAHRLKELRAKPVQKVKKFDPFPRLCVASGLPEPETEYVFLPDRKFRADYAWPAQRLIVERNGGIFRGGKGGGTAKGGHSSGLGILRDMEKSNLAQLAGWTYLQFTPRELNAGVCLDTLKILLRGPHA